MYFGAPSGPGGKFYHGRSDDTAWNRDLNWRLRVTTENKRLEEELRIVARYKRAQIKKKVQKEFSPADVQLLIQAVRKHGPEAWAVVLRSQQYRPLWKYNERQLRAKWREIERTRHLAMHVTLTSIPANESGGLPSVEGGDEGGSAKSRLRRAGDPALVATLESAGAISSNFAARQQRQLGGTGEVFNAKQARQLAEKLKGELEQERVARQRITRQLNKERIGRAVAERKLEDLTLSASASGLGRPSASGLGRPATSASSVRSARPLTSASARSVASLRAAAVAADDGEAEAEEAPHSRPMTAASVAPSAVSVASSRDARRALLERKLQTSRSMRSARSSRSSPALLPIASPLSGRSRSGVVSASPSPSPAVEG